MDRRTADVVARIQGEACFGFHHINAFEEQGTLVVDLCAAPDASIIDELYLDRLEDRLGDPNRGFSSYPRPTRFRIDLERNEVTSTTLTGHGLDLPTTNHRRVRERPYTTVWGVGTDGGWMDRIHALDVSTGQTRTWHEDGTYPGEPIFVERPGATREDDGVLLTVALDAARETSALVALDARTLEPLGRADVGHPIPYGFHGLHTTR